MKRKNLTTASDSFLFRSEQAERDKIQRERRQSRTAVRRVRETSQKTHKRLKAELQRHASRCQCERAEQWLAWRREQQPPNREVKHFKCTSRSKVYIVGGVNTRRLNLSTKPQQATAAVAQSWLGRL